MNEPIDFTDRDMDEFIEWSHDDRGFPKKIRTPMWPDNEYVIYKCRHTGDRFTCEDEGGDVFQLEYRRNWQIYTEPEQSDPALNEQDFWDGVEQDETVRVDTSTPEGFREVIMHCREKGFDYLESSLDCIDWKNSCTGHTIDDLVHWISEGITYRIKPQRVPAVGDVWEVHGHRHLIIKESSIHDGKDTTYYLIDDIDMEGDETIWSDFKDFTYIGQIDLALLKGGE